jgi:hypothetical protein
MREQIRLSNRWLAVLPQLATAGVLTSLLLLGACGESDARSGEEDYADAATGDKASPNTGDKKDAGAKDDAKTGDDVKTGDGDSAQSGDKCGDSTCKGGKCEDDKCVCADGYELADGECKDIDECKARKDDCSGGAVCKNEPGGFKCECTGPAYEQDGEACKCAEGYERDDDGYCAGADGKACKDGIDCQNAHCEGGICCAISCGEPGECQVTDGAKCSEDGKSCVYPRADDGASCDDNKACTKDGTCKEGKCQESTEPTNCNDGNPCTDDSCEEPAGCKNANNTGTCDDGSACTSEDKCSGGECTGTSKDCSASADVCNVGACDDATGECKKEPRTTSATCDDMNSCTSDDACKDGACTGATNACGTNATACEPGAGGEPNMCTCAESFVSFEGRCVPMNDECQRMNPCSPNADCIDPSNTDGDLTCQCKRGFTGDGVDCVQSDPCATNPCGMGGTCANDPGAPNGYTCTCGEGTRPTGGKCGCDLAGTFAVRTLSTIGWKDIDQFLEDGDVTAYTYVLQKQTYDADGTLQAEVLECGGTSFDLCSVPFPPFLGAEAYGQWVPQSIWGSEFMPRAKFSVALSDTSPGAAFKTAEFAIVNGIKLDDPMGEWPSDRRQVGGAPDSEGTPVNGASWLDPDNDGLIGTTTYGVGPGGEQIDGQFPDPPQAYGNESTECPRLNDGARSAYAYPPALPNGSLSVQRIKRFYGATRATLAYDGKIDTCNALSGNISGPDNGQFKMDARVGGCVRVNGSGESACAAGAIDFLDQQPQTQKPSNVSFKMIRVPDGATCRDVQTANYD